jgi:hypothetical protein
VGGVVGGGRTCVCKCVRAPAPGGGGDPPGWDCVKEGSSPVKDRLCDLRQTFAVFEGEHGTLTLTRTHLAYVERLAEGRKGGVPAHVRV